MTRGKLGDGPKSSGGTILSPSQARRLRLERLAEEREWKALAGPLVVRQGRPNELARPPRRLSARAVQRSLRRSYYARPR